MGKAKTHRVRSVALTVSVPSGLADYLDQAEATIKAMANPKIRDAMLSAMSGPGVLKAIGESLGEKLTADEAQQVLSFFKPGKGK
jgi:hypothetical protein